MVGRDLSEPGEQVECLSGIHQRGAGPVGDARWLSSVGSDFVTDQALPIRTSAILILLVRNGHSAVGQPLPKAGRESPPLRVGAAFKRPDEIAHDPAAVEAAELWCDGLAIDVACRWRSESASKRRRCKCWHRICGCVANSGEGRRAIVEGLGQAAIWNKDATKAACAFMSRPPTFFTCPFLIIATAS